MSYNFILVFLMLTCLSCSKDGSSTLLPNPSHIQFFGFTLIDTFWDDPTDTEVKTNYANEVHTFSNIADILVVHPTDVVVDRMHLISDLQMKSVLHISELFFEKTGVGGQSGSIYSLRNDYQERWNQFIATNNLKSHKNNIQTFYIGEEPTWNSISFIELKAATDYVKSLFPEIPILIIEAYPVIDKLQIPNSVDWIGFDHYFVKDPKNNTQFQNELNVLKSKMNDAQHLVFIMDTHYINTAHGSFGGIELKEMKSVAKSYFDLAIHEQKTIAILGYFWPSGFDDPESVGARNMPQPVKDEYTRIGKIITRKK